MKLLLALFAIVVAVLVQQITVTSATSEPVCGYKNSQDTTIFLKYLKYADKGEEYVDFGADGKCLKKVTCTETYHLVEEECDKFPVTCDNIKTFEGVFPACCIKC